MEGDESKELTSLPDLFASACRPNHRSRPSQHAPPFRRNRVPSESGELLLVTKSQPAPEKGGWLGGWEWRSSCQRIVFLPMVMRELPPGSRYRNRTGSRALIAAGLVRSDPPHCVARKPGMCLRNPRVDFPNGWLARPCLCLPRLA